MPPYREVARLPLSRLLGPEDRAEIIDTETPLQEAVARIKKSPARAVLVKPASGDDTEIVGMLQENDISDAMMQGHSPTTPAGELIANRPRPVTVSEHIAVEDVPEVAGPYRILVITDDEGRPRGVITRELLAQRVRRLSYSS
jgi:predicted transcriptional regulator